MTAIAGCAPLTERALRAHLGVPAGADRVMVVTESTHWDPDWLLTSTEYFRLLVRRNLDQAIDALVADPRRVYSLECLFFPDLYWRHRPERRDQFRELVNEGRLRFTGSGVTTPDTLLPEDELLLRDLLIGQEWLRSRGMTQEPRVLYLPDSFGHSPGTPSLLAAAGLGYAAVCRIDGMRFPGADMEPAENFPRPGTSAERLFDERTADFVWQGPDGSEVLAHWMTYGYGHGDMIASGGLSRALALPTAWPDRRERHVASRIDGYIDQLTRVARTPYLLLTIGFDFVRPIPDLVGLLDRWNAHDYERTGVWLVNAGLDDYLDLVSHHRQKLPTLAFDPNPYWMGFYASRPDLKHAARTLGRRLLERDNDRARERLSSDAGKGDAPLVDRVASPAADRRPTPWWRAVTANHHDYITGTAPDRVARGEQRRWLRDALDDLRGNDDLGDSSSTTTTTTIDELVPHRPTAPPPHLSRTGPRSGRGEPSWARHGRQVTVTTAWSVAVFDEDRGGALVSLLDADGNELLRAPSLELRSYAESGGLWRMGHEFNGGRWARHDRSTAHLAAITVHRIDDDGICVAIRTTLDGRPARLTVELRAQHPGMVVHTTVTAPHRRTVTLATHQRSPIAALVMHQPGGMVTRGLSRWYEPTFWPLHSFATAQPPGAVSAPGERSRPGAAVPCVSVATATPTALHATGDGTLETVVARTAIKEIAFRAMPVLAPAWGRRWGTQDADLALEWHASIDPTDPADPTGAVAIGRRLQRRVDHAVGRCAPPWLIDTDDPIVEVIAVKIADRGDGIIVRLRSWAGPRETRVVHLAVAPGVGATIVDAWSTDSLERDRDHLGADHGRTRIEVDSHLSSVRLLLDARRMRSQASRPAT